MRHNLPTLIVVAAMVLSASARANEPTPSGLSRLVKADIGEGGAVPQIPTIGDASLHVQGSEAAVVLKARRSVIVDVLSALTRSYGITYRSSVALDKVVDGSYSGSLGDVIRRTLDGYDFVITQQGSHLDVAIFDKSGQKGTASPLVTVIRQHRIPVTTRISHNR